MKLTNPSDSQEVANEKKLFQDELEIIIHELEANAAFWSDNPGGKYYCPVKNKLLNGIDWLKQALKMMKETNG